MIVSRPAAFAIIIIWLFNLPVHAQAPSSATGQLQPPPANAPKVKAPPVAQQAVTDVGGSSESHDPSGLEPVTAGPLQFTPLKAIYRLDYMNNSRCVITPTIRFKIKNVSSADIKIILFAISFQVTDNQGLAWFQPSNHFSAAISSAGLPLSLSEQAQWSASFSTEKSQYATLSSGQSFQAQVLRDRGNQGICLRDDDITLHRPKTIDLAMSIGVLNIDGSSEIRAVSFSDVPVQVSN